MNENRIFNLNYTITLKKAELSNKNNDDDVNQKED